MGPFLHRPQKCLKNTYINESLGSRQHFFLFQVMSGVRLFLHLRIHIAVLWCHFIWLPSFYLFGFHTCQWSCIVIIYVMVLWGWWDGVWKRCGICICWDLCWTLFQICAGCLWMSLCFIDRPIGAKPKKRWGRDGGTGVKAGLTKMILVTNYYFSICLACVLWNGCVQFIAALCSMRDLFWIFFLIDIRSSVL